MIYAYLTENFFDWAELFLKSYDLFHDTSELIHLETRNLRDYQISHLKELYPNLVIDNKPLNINKLSKKYNVKLSSLLMWKEDISRGKVTPGGSVIWKNIIADGDRIKSFVKVVAKNPDEEYYIFLDIDIIFRRNIAFLRRLGRNHDVSIKFRPSKHIESSRVMIGNIIFRNSKCGNRFIKLWWRKTSSLPMLKRPRAWGQVTFWRTSQEMKEEGCKFFNLPMKVVDGNYKKGALIWSGHKGNKRFRFDKAAEEVERITVEKEAEYEIRESASSLSP
jgi:hypothetical protein